MTVTRAFDGLNVACTAGSSYGGGFYVPHGTTGEILVATGSRRGDAALCKHLHLEGALQQSSGIVQTVVPPSVVACSLVVVSLTSSRGTRDRHGVVDAA